MCCRCDPEDPKKWFISALYGPIFPYDTAPVNLRVIKHKCFSVSLQKGTNKNNKTKLAVSADVFGGFSFYPL